MMMYTLSWYKPLVLRAFTEENEGFEDGPIVNPF